MTDVEVVETASFGRVLKAKRSFERGEVVLSEKPIICSLSESSFTTDETHEIDKARIETGLDLLSDLLFLKAFCLSSVDSQEQALDCYTPSLCLVDESSLLREIVRVVPVAQRFSWSKKVSSEVLKKIVLIKATNAHQFNIEDESASALFFRGSKIRHSCRPNVVYSSQREIGRGSFVAIRKIPDNEEILFSYIDTFQSVQMRRHILKNNYLFHCQCDLCQAEHEPIEESNDQGRKQVEWLDRIRATFSINEVEDELLKISKTYNKDHPLYKNSEKHMLSLLVDQAVTKPSQASINRIIKTTDELLQWSGDPGFIGSTLLRAGCEVGRAGHFKDAERLLKLAYEDQALVFTPECDHQNFCHRAISACRLKDSASVPELEPQHAQSDACPVQ